MRPADSWRRSSPRAHIVTAQPSAASACDDREAHPGRRAADDGCLPLESQVHAAQGSRFQPAAAAPDPAGTILRVGHVSVRLRRRARLATASARRLPDFLVIGAQRAGSTSLFAQLCEHPGVAAPSHKEIHYFDLQSFRGLRWYRSHFPPAGRSRGRITGEASPYYLFHPAVPARVAEALPDVRLVALLRDPVARAYSQYQLSVRDGHETLGFEEALASRAGAAGRRGGAAARPTAPTEATPTATSPTPRAAPTPTSCRRWHAHVAARAAARGLERGALRRSRPDDRRGARVPRPRRRGRPAAPGAKPAPVSADERRGPVAPRGAVRRAQPASSTSWSAATSAGRAASGGGPVNILWVIVDCLRADMLARAARRVARGVAAGRRGHRVHRLLLDLPDDDARVHVDVHGPVPDRPRRARPARHPALAESMPTVAERLSAAGYATWCSATGPAASDRRDVPRLRGRRVPRGRRPLGALGVRVAGTGPGRGSSRAAERPYLAVLHIWDVHMPRRYPARFDRRRYGRDAYERADRGPRPLARDAALRWSATRRSSSSPATTARTRGSSRTRCAPRSSTGGPSAGCRSSPGPSGR